MRRRELWLFAFLWWWESKDNPPPPPYMPSTPGNGGLILTPRKIRRLISWDGGVILDSHGVNDMSQPVNSVQDKHWPHVCQKNMYLKLCVCVYVSFGYVFQSTCFVTIFVMLELNFTEYDNEPCYSCEQVSTCRTCHYHDPTDAWITTPPQSQSSPWLLYVLFSGSQP